ncbi:MAG: tRNA (adenosine(37)-N6)-dimethylallyltransferase MiaA [Dysgonamonadaceae bacterium]|jgi:tRNA dimethylallyltransferase|nr:tRNA (adenosine(37)-N6)-dimethylallyltransferase MiaA [Dysgonamonadaceae bacterium]
MKYELLTVLGPTATGKTALAARLADELKTSVISADSRQIYRGMDIGTGKDMNEYIIDGRKIPCYLTDICDAGEKFNLFRYQREFHKVFRELRERGETPVLCGGTGLYIESVLKGFRLLDVPPNPALRESLNGKSLAELEQILRSYKKLHNTTDIDLPQRAVRAIEIEEFYRQHSEPAKQEYPPINSLIIGMQIDRDLRREKITARLKARLDEGMIDEVQGLLDSGVPPESLIYYGLEYKYVTLHVIGELNYDEMFRRLETAIHQFAKRQMTWFRGMERRGFTVNWLDATLPMEEKIRKILSLL